MHTIGISTMNAISATTLEYDLYDHALLVFLTMSHIKKSQNLPLPKNLKKSAKNPKNREKKIQRRQNGPAEEARAGVEDEARIRCQENG
jgi:hypothetical protein